MRRNMNKKKHFKVTFSIHLEFLLFSGESVKKNNNFAIHLFFTIFLCVLAAIIINGDNTLLSKNKQSLLFGLFDDSKVGVVDSSDHSPLIQHRDYFIKCMGLFHRF